MSCFQPYFLTRAPLRDVGFEGDGGRDPKCVCGGSHPISASSVWRNVHKRCCHALFFWNRLCIISGKAPRADKDVVGMNALVLLLLLYNRWCTVSSPSDDLTMSVPARRGPGPPPTVIFSLLPDPSEGKSKTGIGNYNTCTPRYPSNMESVRYFADTRSRA